MHSVIQGETCTENVMHRVMHSVMQGETRTEKRLKETVHKARMEAEMTEYNEQLKRDEEAAQAAITQAVTVCNAGCHRM